MITRLDDFVYLVFIRQGVPPVRVSCMESAEHVLCQLWWMAS